MGSSNIFTNTLDAIAGTDLSGNKKKAREKEKKMQQQLEAEKKEQKREQEKEKEKQKKTSQNFYESMRQGNLGLLAAKDKQTIG